MGGVGLPRLSGSTGEHKRFQGGLQGAVEIFHTGWRWEGQAEDGLCSSENAAGSPFLGEKGHALLSAVLASWDFLL